MPGSENSIFKHNIITRQQTTSSQEDLKFNYIDN